MKSEKSSTNCNPSRLWMPLCSLAGMKPKMPPEMQQLQELPLSQGKHLVRNQLCPAGQPRQGSRSSLSPGGPFQPRIFHNSAIPQGEMAGEAFPSLQQDMNSAAAPQTHFILFYFLARMQQLQWFPAASKNSFSDSETLPSKAPRLWGFLLHF